MGRIEEEWSDAGATASKMAGAKSNQSPGNHNGTKTIYDPIGNLTNVDYPGAAMDIVLKYDLRNRLTNVTDLIGTTKLHGGRSIGH